MLGIPLSLPNALRRSVFPQKNVEAIMLDDADRRCFRETLSATCAKTSWQVHAYCLMENAVGS